MLQTLTYQTTALQDNYSILNEAVRIGKVYKTEWLGWTMDAEIAGRRFKFMKSGLFTRVIHIEDKATRSSLGKLFIKPLFRWVPRATLELEDGNTYRWLNSRLLGTDWQWQQNHRIVMSAKEPWQFSGANGSVLVRASVPEKELLLSLGLMLRNDHARRSIFGLLMGAAIIGFGALTRLFMGH